MFNQENKMKRRCLKLPTLLILVCFYLITILPAAALAGPPGPGPKPGHGPGRGHRGKGGPAFRHVPPGGQMIRFGALDYFFHSGRCYRHGPDGYSWVRPPVGIIAFGLPEAAVAVLIGGLTYYVYDDVYYRRVPSGYQVVEIPTQTTTVVTTSPAPPVSAAVEGTQVVVTAKVLNVRSGPGKNHNVLTKTYMGHILIVRGSASDWYYVRLPNNTYGWVMKSLVSVPGGGAQG